jgi:hypothetical protein
LYEPENEIDLRDHVSTPPFMGSQPHSLRRAGVPTLASGEVANVRPLNAVLASGAVGVHDVAATVAPELVVEPAYVQRSAMLHGRGLSLQSYPLFVPEELPVPARRVWLPGNANAPVTNVQAARRVVKETMANEGKVRLSWVGESPLGLG